jgi:hypothetical protein
MVIQYIEQCCATKHTDEGHSSSLGARNLSPLQQHWGRFSGKLTVLFSLFEVRGGTLRQWRLVPAGAATSDPSSGVEVALQCCGQSSRDQGVPVIG